MGIAEKIRILLVKRGNISEAELARKLQAEGLANMSPQNFNNKMKRESFSRPELDAIAGIMGATYNVDPPPREWFTLNDTGEEI
jgi:hypothetical protein